MPFPFPSAAVEAAATSAAVLVVVCSGRRRLQWAFMVIGLTCGLLAVVGPGALDAPKAPPSSVATMVALGLLAFSGWNLFARAGERWSFRVVIYSLYSAGFAGMAAYFSAHGTTHLTTRDWVLCGVVYVVTSIAIVSTKPWFAARMRTC